MWCSKDARLSTRDAGRDGDHRRMPCLEDSPTRRGPSNTRSRAAVRAECAGGHLYVLTVATSTQIRANARFSEKFVSSMITGTLGWRAAANMERAKAASRARTLEKFCPPMEGSKPPTLRDRQRPVT